LIVHANTHTHTHTHEPPQPYPVPVLALEGAVSPLGISCGRFAGAHVRTRRFGAQEYGGCSRRIGSVLNGSAVRAVARGGTRRFATLTPRATAPLPSWNRMGKGTGSWGASAAPEASKHPTEVADFDPQETFPRRVWSAIGNFQRSATLMVNDWAVVPRASLRGEEKHA
jgi:hypothetical protein